MLLRFHEVWSWIWTSSGWSVSKSCQYKHFFSFSSFNMFSFLIWSFWYEDVGKGQMSLMGTWVESTMSFWGGGWSLAVTEKFRLFSSLTGFQLRLTNIRYLKFRLVMSFKRTFIEDYQDFYVLRSIWFLKKKY